MKNTEYKAAEPITNNARCPHCGSKAALTKIDGVQDAIMKYKNSSNGICRYGIRKCPDLNCNAISFVELAIPDNSMLSLYPIAADFEFKSEGIPENIFINFQESLRCFSQKGYISSAIMIRRTLELICENFECRGKDLHHRILDLKTKEILPPKTIEAMLELKLFGNDAAHVEVKYYDEIQKSQAEDAINLVVHVLETIYSGGAILERLQNHKSENNQTPQ